jgi:hypothetical protein
MAFSGKTVERKGPDFSDIDSREKAAGHRDLEALLLMPAEFGGQPVPENTVYVPIGIAAAKVSIDHAVAQAVTAGKVSRYSASPEYRGKSFVPIKILIRAWNPGDLTASIAVWGDALND